MRPLWICQISSRSDNPPTRYLLPNFVDFIDGMTNKKVKDWWILLHGIMGPPDHNSTNSTGQIPNPAKFHCAVTKSVRYLPWKIFAPRISSWKRECQFAGVKFGRTPTTTLEISSFTNSPPRTRNRPKFTKFGNKYQLARPITPPNFVTLRQKVCEIFTVENFCSRKSRPKFTKIGDDLPCTNAPHCAKFHRARPNDVWEKRKKTFYTFLC